MGEAPNADATFGQMLRDLRHAAGLSQEELAERSGLSIRTISNMERSQASRPYPRSVRLLAGALRLDEPTRTAFEAAARGQRPGNEWVADEPAAAAQTAVATRTLPRDIAGFTGRQQELDRLAETAAGTGGVVRIQAIGGMAGVGKTALAVHAAHRLAPRFPDGQVFIPLHGHTPGYCPVDPADALASLLLTAGVSAARIPPDLEARARLWRDHLAGRKVLLVFDDAISTEQVAPLLPGTGESLVLVTSRRHLTALDDAQVISLDVLPPDEAAELLVRLATRLGLAAGDAAVAEICRLCGHLPLAIGMLARRLHHRPAWTPGGLAAELAAAQDRLQLMTAENLSVAAAFDLSYADLTDDQRRLFRRLGLSPGSDFDAYAAAALTDSSLAAARRRLAALYDHYLVAEPTEGRYRLHDLLREHARRLGAREEPASDTDAARIRLLDYYTYAAALAGEHLDRHTQPPADQTWSTRPAEAPSLTDETTALAWARPERANLFACLDQASQAGDHGRVVALTAGLGGLLRRDGPWSEAIARHRAAVQAARQTDDRHGVANALNNLADTWRWAGTAARGAEALEEALTIYRDLGDRLGQANALFNQAAVHRMAGDYSVAAATLAEALTIYRDIGDRFGQANALQDLGIVQYLTGDYSLAAQALEAALGSYRDLGNRLGQANALLGLGAVRRGTGDYQDAAQILEMSLSLFHDLGDRRGQGNALNSLGTVRRETGDYPGAAHAEEAALSIFQELGDQLGQANALGDLGAVWTLSGDYPGAARALEAALGIYRDIGERGGEVVALNETGALHLARGDHPQAEAFHREALKLAREIDSSWDEAHALAGLGRCALAAGRRADGIAGLREAAEIFRRIGAAETADVAAELTALGG
jgi:tetratricopeptide (TPR) repeat protein/transcriptional regulator with XRE-family HTH domain